MSITVADFMTLPPCSETRRDQKRRLIAHRRERSVALGPCMRLQFEDELTIRHQIREVLRAERITGIEAMQHEIDTYAHLLPDGLNWKATLLIELPDAHERRRRLPQLDKAAHRIYMDVAQQSRVFAQANEDLIDRHLTRLSAVHFLRLQFCEPSRAVVLSGATVTLGCAHDQYAFRRVVPPATMTRLRRDLVPASHQHAVAQVMPSPAPTTA
jgi:Protein of unknown function (DUF3501)